VDTQTSQGYFPVPFVTKPAGNGCHTLSCPCRTRSPGKADVVFKEPESEKVQVGMHISPTLQWPMQLLLLQQWHPEFISLPCSIIANFLCRGWWGWCQGQIRSIIFLAVCLLFPCWGCQETDPQRHSQRLPCLQCQPYHGMNRAERDPWSLSVILCLDHRFTPWWFRHGNVKATALTLSNK
jgi:hypothetical protein